MLDLHAFIAVVSSGLLTLSPAQSGEPVPVQRPAALEDAREAAEEAVEEAVEAASAGRIEGFAHDAEHPGRTVAGARVELMCSCLPDPLVTTSDDQGRFSFDDLPAGEYTLFVDRGGEVATRLLALPTGAVRAAALEVPPPFPTALREREERELVRSRVMLSVGGVAVATAVLMFISAGVESAKPACRFGPEGCENPPRPGMIGALAGVGGVLALGGGTLLVAGTRRMRRIDARLLVDGQTAGLSVRGRF
jgi:hypothetical protein